MWAVAACVDSLRGALSKLGRALRLSLLVFTRSTGRRPFMCASMSEDCLCIGACLTVSWVRVPAPVQGVGVLGVAAVDAVAAVVVLGLCEQLASVLRRGAAGLQVPVLVAFARAHRKRPGRCGTYRASLAESRFCPSCSLGLRSSY